MDSVLSWLVAKLL